MRTKLIAILAITGVVAIAQDAGNSGYTGPQILSRGLGAAGDRPGAGTTSGFQYYLGASADYETGLLPASVDSKGKVVSTDGLYGVLANWGAYGKHSWTRTTLGLDYMGNYRHYQSYSGYDGSDHVLGLNVATQLTRHLQLNSSTTAGTVSRYYAAGPLNSPALYTSAGSPIFDNRAYVFETSAGFVYQVNARLSFSADGTGFTVRRQSDALVGLNGWAAQGTAAYRLAKTRTVDVSYSFAHYDYRHGFGESDVATYLAGISQGFGRRWEASISAGAAGISTIGLEQVSVDPITAALFGTSVTTQTFSRMIYQGAGRASLRGKFKRSSAEFFAAHMPSSGNGVYLTSNQTNVGASAGYTGIKRMSLGWSVQYIRLGSIGQSQLGIYDYWTGGFTSSIKLVRSLEAMASFEARNIEIDQAGFARLSYRTTIGVNWHPSEIPISFW